MIRSALVADIWALRRKPQRRVFLYTPLMLASSFRVYAHLLRSLPGPLNQKCVTSVLRDGGLRGIMQAQRRSHGQAADIVYMNAYLHGSKRPMSEGDIWYQLGNHLMAQLGEHRFERVYAAIPHRLDDVAEVTRQLGFQPYCQQRLWMLAEPLIESGSTLRAMRPQRSRDAWAVHQLFCSLTPRHVQMAEMRESTDWQLRRRQLNYRERSWVLGDDQHITAHFRVQSGSRSHVLRFMVAPHLRSEVSVLLRYVLSQLNEPKPVFALVYGFQSEHEAAFEEVGFIQRGEQTLYVKQLALRAVQPARSPFLRTEPLELAGSKRIFPVSEG
ncbi:MAG: hypothetical protein NVS4B8_06880 [Herpetosiphon sp.]